MEFKKLDGNILKDDQIIFYEETAQDMEHDSLIE